MNEWTVVISAFLGGGLLTAVFNFFTNRRTTRIDETTKIQVVYEKTLDDMVERHDKEKTECAKEIANLRGQLENARQNQGELLVKVDDLKTQLSKVGGDVNQITGDLKKLDPQALGRRANDKPGTST